MICLAQRVIVETLRRGGAVSFRALGQSMWPSIPSGSQLHVIPCSAADLAEGDLAAFERNGAVVVHRVIARHPTGLICRGDGPRQAPEVVAAQQVLGRVDRVQRRPLRRRVIAKEQLVPFARWLLRRCRKALRARGVRAPTPQGSAGRTQRKPS